MYDDMETKSSVSLQLQSIAEWLDENNNEVMKEQLI